MRFGQAARVVVVLFCVVMAAASASAPKPPSAYNVKKTDIVKNTPDAVWTALVDLFGERSWTIDKLDKPSGIITTEWLKLGAADASTHADCGSAPMATTVNTQVRFNVIVREASGGSSVSVNTKFRQIRAFDSKVWAVDCSSTGEVEAFIQAQVADRAGHAAPKADPNARKTVTGSSPLYCAVTAPDVGVCYQTEVNCTEALTEGAPPCERKDAGACFTASKVLDGSKATTCAVSIRDCETRRTELAANPDFTVTACGIYRVEQH